MSTIDEILEKLDLIKDLIKNQQEQTFQESEEDLESLESLELPVYHRKYTYGLKFERPNKQKLLKLWSIGQKATVIPTSVDLRNEYMPPIFNQEQLGSCTANGLAAAFSYQYNVEFKKQIIPSRLFIYYNERRLEGTISTDSGAAISDGVKVLETLGTCTEASWPYIISKFAVRPPAQDYKFALKQKVTQASQVNATVADFKTAIANGYPVVMGFSVPATVENIGSNGFMPPYDKNNSEDQILGGHCVCAVGFDDNMTDNINPAGYFIIRNSWGEQYANNGYFYMPYSFFDSGLISDCWVLDLVTAKV